MCVYICGTLSQEATREPAYFDVDAAWKPPAWASRPFFKGSEVWVSVLEAQFRGP